MRRSVLVCLICSLCVTKSMSQAYVRTDIIGRSVYRDENNRKVEGSKGSAESYQIGVNVPFAVKIDSYERPQVWGVALSGSYTALHNEQLGRTLSPDEIMNI